MNDPYVYKDSDVLINSFNIKDQDELNQLESTFFQLSFSKLMEEGYEIKTIDDFFNVTQNIVFRNIHLGWNRAQNKHFQKRTGTKWFER